MPSSFVGRSGAFSPKLRELRSALPVRSPQRRPKLSLTYTTKRLLLRGGAVMLLDPDALAPPLAGMRRDVNPLEAPPGLGHTPGLLSARLIRSRTVACGHSATVQLQLSIIILIPVAQR